VVVKECGTENMTEPRRNGRNRYGPSGGLWMSGDRGGGVVDGDEVEAVGGVMLWRDEV